MSKQYHYVVMYDENTNKFSIEWDSTQLLLEDDNGTVFDTVQGVWLSSYEEDLEPEYESKGMLLSKILGEANGGL